MCSCGMKENTSAAAFPRFVETHLMTLSMVLTGTPSTATKMLCRSVDRQRGTRWDGVDGTMSFRIKLFVFVHVQVDTECCVVSAYLDRYVD